MRPKSAKANEKRIIAKKKNGRPISAKKNLVNIASKLSIKPQQDAYLLTRLKPTYISIDKERLYEDNMALKLALNGLQVENTKIKTRLTQLEKELARKDDIIEELSVGEKSPGHKYAHLVNNLKQAIKEGKIEMKAKDEEIYSLRRNIKSTKVKEMEIQIQELEGECRRLGHNLDEALNRHSNFGSVNEYDKKFNSDLVLSLKKENSELKANFSRVQEELRRFQQERVVDNEKVKKGAVNSQQNSNLKLEIQKLRAQLEGSHKEARDRERQLNQDLVSEKKRVEELRHRLENEEKKTKEQQKQIEGLKNSMKTPEGRKTPRSVTPQKSPRAIQVIKKLKKVLKKQKISFQRFLDVLDKDHTGFVEVEECIKFFKTHNKQVKRQEFEYFTEKKSGKTVLNLIKLQKNYEKLVESSSSSSSSEKPLITPSKVPVFSSDFSPIEPLGLEKEVEDCLKHISLCMQLNRIEKTQIFETFFSKLDMDRSISRTELSRAIKNPPFAFPQKVPIEKLCDFLLKVSSNYSKQQKSVQVKEIINKLEKFLPDWQIFDASDEENFDSELTKVIIKNKKVIKENCRKFDKKESGTITLEEFKITIKDFKELEKGRIFQYMTLLFYSHEYELDKVPYLHFIKAYGEQNTEESQEYSEGEKAQIVKHYLNEIAQSLKKQKQAVRSAFQVENNLIYPESFISGLENLGMKSIEHDFIVLILEALQYEKEDEACIYIDEFEKIMENLGVSNKPKNRAIRESSESSESEEIKKISIAESGNYDYSDDSQGRNKISEISPFASVSNPGLKASVSAQKIFDKRQSPDPSSKLTLIVSKIENESEKKRDSSSDSIRDILKKKPSDSNSSSFNSKKKNQAVLFKGNELGLSLERKSSDDKKKQVNMTSSSESYGYSDSPKISQIKQSPIKGLSKSPSSSSESKTNEKIVSEHNYEEDYEQENFDSSSSEPVVFKPSDTFNKPNKSSSSSSKKSEKSKKNSFTLGIEQSKNSPSQENPVPDTINLSKSFKNPSFQIDNSEHFSSSQSSSKKKIKNPNLPIVFKEDLPGQESLPSNTTGNFGKKGLPLIAPHANPVFDASKSDSNRIPMKNLPPVSVNPGKSNSSTGPMIIPQFPTVFTSNVTDKHIEFTPLPITEPEPLKMNQVNSSSSSSSSEEYYQDESVQKKSSSSSKSSEEKSSNPFVVEPSKKFPKNSELRSPDSPQNFSSPFKNIESNESMNEKISKNSSSEEVNVIDSSSSSKRLNLKKEDEELPNLISMPVGALENHQIMQEINLPSPFIPAASIVIPPAPSYQNKPFGIPSQSDSSSSSSSSSELIGSDIASINKSSSSKKIGKNNSSGSSKSKKQAKNKSSSSSSSKKLSKKKSYSSSSSKKTPKSKSPLKNIAKNHSSSSSSSKKPVKNKSPSSSSSKKVAKSSSSRKPSNNYHPVSSIKHSDPSDNSENYDDDFVEEKLSDALSSKENPKPVLTKQNSDSQSSFIKEDLASNSEISDEMF